MLSLEHYNEEIARLVSSLQIETGKFPQPLKLSLNPESIPFLTFFVGERKVTVLVFGKYFDLRDPLSSVFAQVFTNRAVAGVKHTLGWAS